MNNFWDWFGRHFDWCWHVPDLPRENITEMCHRLRIQPPSKI